MADAIGADEAMGALGQTLRGLEAALTDLESIDVVLP